MVANKVSREIIDLAHGSSSVISCFSGLIINGFCFHTISRERSRRIQNSGVMVIADGQPYYGRYVRMFDLDYYDAFLVTMFRCHWVHINSPRGMKTDSNVLTMMNFSRLIHTRKLFVWWFIYIRFIAKQVLYVEDCKSKRWFSCYNDNAKGMYINVVECRHEDEDDEIY